MMTDVQRVNRTLDRAIQGGLIAPLDLGASFRLWSPPGMSSHAVELARGLPVCKARRRDIITDQWQDPARDTRIQRYQDAGYTWSTSFDSEVYEIARFVASPDEVGVVKYCGTFVEINRAGEPNYVELDPGDPFTLSRNGVEVRFILRLYQGTFQPLGPPWSGSYAGCQGYGYGPLPFWDDYRFFWGRTANDVWWLVPANHCLRMYIKINNGADQVRRVLGRLQGFTQPIYTEPASYNVTHAW